MSLHIINVLLLFLWGTYIIVLPGLAILVILYNDFKERFTAVEILALSIGIGTCSVIILTLVLDELLIVTLGTVILTFLFFPMLVILFYRKNFYYWFKSTKIEISREYVFKALCLIKLRIKRVFAKFNVLHLMLILVISFIASIELNDLLSNIVLPVKDPWFWLIESKRFVLSGHFLSEDRYFQDHPHGVVYFLGLIFLPNLINPYYITLFIGPFLSLLQSLGVYILSKRILKSDKMAIYSVLVYGTSRLIVWRGKFLTPDSIGLFLITILTWFLFEKDLKSYIPGLLTLSGMALTSFGTTATIILPILLYLILFKSRRISIIIVGLLSAGILFLSNFVARFLILASRVPFRIDILPLDVFFYNHAQWTFGYSLAFSFIGIIYCLLNRSPERWFYLICFFELFIMISFYPLRYPGRNYPFFSIFASTLAAQGLIASIQFFKRYFPVSIKRWNVRAYIIHLIVVLCIVYQVFFGMVRGYHATTGRYYINSEIVAVLWLDDNSPKDAIVLAAPVGRTTSYLYILYPREIIFNPEIYNYDSISDLTVLCFENNINYIIMKFDDFSYVMKADANFKEVYRNSLMVIFEYLPMN